MGGLEYWIITIGAKTCCIAAAGCGGAANALTKRAFNLDGVKDVVVAVIVGWIAAELFIPAIMQHWGLAIIWGPAIAFMVGYSGIRLLPVIEARARRFIEGDDIRQTESEITQRRLREALLSDEGMEWLMEKEDMIRAARDTKEKK
tara:strand:+ start:1796 stop:2233 length:438 start_codon:yes stop_codon:yes gene_type:complete